MDDYRGENATTEDFVRLSESVTGRKLDGFFDRWLYEKGLLSLPEEPPEQHGCAATVQQPG